MDSTHNTLVYDSADARRTPRPLGLINRYSLLIPLCVLGIVTANAYSLMITNNGLLVSNIFPDLWILDRQIPHGYATFVFALVLQFGIMVLYLLLAVARPVQKLTVAPFLAALVAVSFYFGFLSVHSNSRGDAYVASLTKRVENLTSAVTGENLFMAASVSQALEGNLQLAESARRGRDKTGIAACGALCQGYFDRAEAIRSRYGHLLVVPELAPAGTDIRVQWREAATQYADYANRATDYARFLEEQDAAQGYEEKPALRDAHEDLAQIFGKGMDDRWMLTAHSLREIRKDVSVAVSALISIMPDVMSLALSLTIGTLLRLSQRGVSTRRRERSQQAAASSPDRREPHLGRLPAPVEASDLPLPPAGVPASKDPAIADTR